MGLYFHSKHSVKSVGIRSYSGPHFAAFKLNTGNSIKMQINADQNNYEYGHFSRSGILFVCLKFAQFLPLKSMFNMKN